MKLTLLLLHKVYLKAKLTPSSVEKNVVCAKWTMFNPHTVHLYSSAIYFVSLILNATNTANTFLKYWYRCNKGASMDSICSPGSFWLTYLAGIKAVWLSYLKLLCDFKFPLCGLRQLKAYRIYFQSSILTDIGRNANVSQEQLFTHTLTHSHTYANTHVHISMGFNQ